MIQKIKSFTDFRLKLVLTILFAVLCILEFVDGRVDVSDFTIPALLFIVFSEIIYTFIRTRGVSNVEYSDSSTQLSIFERGNLGFIGWVRLLDKRQLSRFIFNITIFFIFLVALILDLNIVAHGTNDLVVNIFMVLWGSVFFLVSIKELQKAFSYYNVFITQVAFCLIMSFLFLL
ncbi:putative membrane protein [Halobacteriovorax marinus SJ]|uniref:Membrane protein n=1 Tax=Halobacteriovorax marinus (strain ATCC BAA-682 / DSM 15412 / SJ) TaxID=862908 RepID=E1X3A3_HALMS|nr:hypothetical protein [Halobacteriovorax marinus]CBW25198.1 putative membrane protein [Halobacteriovorax marinus SJ]